MNASPASPFSLPETAPALAGRLALILAGLGALVARRFVRMPHLSGYTLLLWGRLNRVVRRFARALALPAGKVRRPRARVARDNSARTLALPMGRGWLVRELGWEAAAYMSQLAALLADPAMQAALVASPAVGRILRPICRMLGVSAALAAPAEGKPLREVAPAMRPALLAMHGVVLAPDEIFASA